MSEFCDQVYDSFGHNYDEFNSSNGYDGYVEDLESQYQAGIICQTLLRRATKQGKRYNFEFWN